MKNLFIAIQCVFFTLCFAEDHFEGHKQKKHHHSKHEECDVNAPDGTMSISGTFSVFSALGGPVGQPGSISTATYAIYYTTPKETKMFKDGTLKSSIKGEQNDINFQTNVPFLIGNYKFFAIITTNIQSQSFPPQNINLSNIALSVRVNVQQNVQFDIKPILPTVLINNTFIESLKSEEVFVSFSDANFGVEINYTNYDLTP